MFGTVQVVGLLAHEEHTERVTSATRRSPCSTSPPMAAGSRSSAPTSTRSTSRPRQRRARRHRVHPRGGGRPAEVRAVPAVIDRTLVQADLRIVVPRDLEVKVRADDDRVLVRGLAGRVDATPATARVEAEALPAPRRSCAPPTAVRATGCAPQHPGRSRQRSVRLEFASRRGRPSPDSDNGTVEVALPRGDQGYDVDIASDNGSTDNLVQTDSTSDHRSSPPATTAASPSATSTDASRPAQLPRASSIEVDLVEDQVERVGRPRWARSAAGARA